MLETIKKLPAPDAEAVLCNALNAFLPNALDVELGELEREVIREARTAGAADDDAAVAERLESELLSLALPPEAEEHARIRLGHTWGLTRDNYEIGPFGDIWSNAYNGITPEEAVAAFRGAERAEYGGLSPDFDPSHDGYQSTGLFAARAFAPREHWILVAAANRGNVVTLQRAWRLFPGDVPLPPAARPKQMLERFLVRFGADFRIKGRPGKHLLVWQEAIPSSKLRPRDWLDLFEFDYPASFAFEAELIARDTNLGFILVYYGFVIDTKRYRSALARHGF